MRRGENAANGGGGVAGQHTRRRGACSSSGSHRGRASTRGPRLLGAVAQANGRGLSKLLATRCGSRGAPRAAICDAHRAAAVARELRCATTSSRRHSVVAAGHVWRAGRRGRVGSRPWTQCGRAQRVRAASERHACAIQPRDARAGMHLRRGSPTKHVAWSDGNFGTMTFVTFARPHPSQPPGRARDPRTPTGGRLWLPIRSQNHVTMMRGGAPGLQRVGKAHTLVHW